MDKKKIIAYKINLKDFIDTLINLYDNDEYNFIDLEFIQGITQEEDIVRVHVNEGYKQEFEENSEDENMYLGVDEKDFPELLTNKIISDDDLEELT